MSEASGEQLILQHFALNRDKVGVVEYISDAGDSDDIRIRAAVTFAEERHSAVATELLEMIGDDEMRDVGWAKVAPALARWGMEDDAEDCLSRILSDSIRADAAGDVASAFQHHQQSLASW